MMEDTSIHFLHFVCLTDGSDPHLGEAMRAAPQLNHNPALRYDRWTVASDVKALK
jgi:hypothetical protein